MLSILISEVFIIESILASSLLKLMIQSSACASTGEASSFLINNLKSSYDIIRCVDFSESSLTKNEI